MKVTAVKLTDERLMQVACSSTMQGKESKMTLDKIYSCRHSPLRTQIFWIEMEDIPTFVSVHLSRHKVGCEHFVGSNREDRSYKNGEEVTRNTPVNHSMLLNAESLMNMALKRLCGQSSKETQEVMQLIKEAVAVVDPVLAKYLVRTCEYRNGICPELKCCGNLWTAEEKSVKPNLKED